MTHPFLQSKLDDINETPLDVAYWLIGHSSGKELAHAIAELVEMARANTAAVRGEEIE